MGGLRQVWTRLSRWDRLRSVRQRERAAGNRLEFLRPLRIEPMEQRCLLSIGTGDAGATAPFNYFASTSATSSQLPHPQYIVYTPLGPALGVKGAASLSGSAGYTPGYSPAQIRTAYGINSISLGGVVGDGTGQTIALLDFGDAPNLVDSTSPNFINSDLHRFDQQFGLPDPPSFIKMNGNGDPTPANLPPVFSGWPLEESLDVEWAHAVAPKANLILIESDGWFDFTSPGFANVSVVSMSWVGGGSYSEFTTPAGHTGMTFLAATGDWVRGRILPGGFARRRRGGRHVAVPRRRRHIQQRIRVERNRRRSGHRRNRAKLPVGRAEQRLAASSGRFLRCGSLHRRGGPRFL